MMTITKTIHEDSLEIMNRGLSSYVKENTSIDNSVYDLSVKFAEESDELTKEIFSLAYTLKLVDVDDPRFTEECRNALYKPIKEEIADCYILLAQLSNMVGFKDDDLMEKLQDIEVRYPKEDL